MGNLRLVPNSGKAVMMRNARTGASWIVSFDYTNSTYWHEPVGNTRNIRSGYAAASVNPRLVLAGTH